MRREGFFVFAPISPGTECTWKLHVPIHQPLAIRSYEYARYLKTIAVLGWSKPELPNPGLCPGGKRWPCIMTGEELTDKRYCNSPLPREPGRVQAVENAS